MLARFHRSSHKKKKLDSYEDSADPHKLDKSLMSLIANNSKRTLSKTNPFDLYLNCRDALEYLEPLPVLPPDYSTLAQSSPRFPVYQHADEGHEKLPHYTPTIYKLDKFIRKLEWVSPYDPSPTRHWKDVIMELNSTQLNIYYLEPHAKNLVNHLPMLPDQDVIRHPALDQCKSSLTTIRDLSNVIQFEKFKIWRRENLLKSYSLQHAKVGLAQDYKKHKYTLRLRCETEQFIVQFPDAESMIEWNLALSVGRDNALDLNKRSMPHYRTVPRRRHHHHYSHSGVWLSSSSGSQSRRRRKNRRRNNSEPDILQRSRNNSVSNFFHRRRAISSPTPTTADLEVGLRNRFSSMVLRHNNKPVPVSNHRTSVTSSSLNYDLVNQYHLEDDVSMQSGSPADVSEVSTQVGHTTREEIEIEEAELHNTEEEFEIDDIRALEDDEDDEDEDDEDEDDTEEEDEDSIEEEDIEEALSTIPALPFVSTTSTSTDLSTTHSPTSTTTNTTTTTIDNDDALDIDFKWSPEFDRLPSSRKIIKDAIRCMSTLSTTDHWCGRNVVKAYDFEKLGAAGGMPGGGSTTNMGNALKRYTSRNAHGHLRFVKEYVVTSSGLVPTS